MAEAKPKYRSQRVASADGGLRRMEQFLSLEPRLTFMSVFPVSQGAHPLCLDMNNMMPSEDRKFGGG